MLNDNGKERGTDRKNVKKSLYSGKSRLSGKGRSSRKV